MPDTDTPVLPAALYPGDRLGLVAPASRADDDRVQRAAAKLTKRGYEVVFFREPFPGHGYLAGTDESRAGELMEAFRDESVRAVLPVRGGYGVMRLLDRLDFAEITRHSKVFVGFSDCTALHLALQKHCGWVTFHGPHPADGIGHPQGWSLPTEASYWRLLETPTAAFTAEQSLLPASWDTAPLTTLHGGSVEGRLTGGNLSLVCALLGTPYEVDCRDRILFLEEIDEPPYRIDRLLAQLKLAGKLETVAAVVLGQFTDCRAPAGRPTLDVDTVLHDYFGSLPVPIIANFPSGHARDNVTLPFNVRVRLDADRKQLMLLEPCVT